MDGSMLARTFFTLQGWSVQGRSLWVLVAESTFFEDGRRRNFRRRTETTKTINPSLDALHHT